MSRQAKSFWLAVAVAGFTTAAVCLAHWRLHAADLPLFATYFIAAFATSRFKVRIPLIESTLSMNYVFVLAGLIDLHLGAGLLIATVGVLGQTYHKPESKPRIHHLIFNFSIIWLSVAMASLCFSYEGLYSLDRFGIVSIVTGSLVYFMVNTALLSGIIGLTSGQPIFDLWKASYRWTSAQYVVGGIVAACLRQVVDYVGWLGALCAVPVLYLMHRSYTVYVARIGEQQKHIGEMAGLHLRTIEALALAIDAKDDTTAAHLRRVQVYASELGRELGLSQVEMQAIEAASLLHDIGKLAVPEHIISKPGRLTPDEFEKMKIHPTVGAEILERVDFPYPVVPIVRSHHEKFDGTGYPDGLKGEEIPIGARILAAVDCLDALASDRQYRKALPLDEAIQIVIGESGKSYDPKVVAVLAARYKELELKAKSDSAETAKVSSHVKVERGARPRQALPPMEKPPATAITSA
jgi:putative nucleotidyltransferase with HDIG domain